MTAPAGTRILLVVDDDDDVAGVMVRLFERRGWAVHRARGGSEAAALARSHPPDGAIVDLVLPGVGGLEVVRILRQHSPACRIVAVSGMAGPAFGQAFKDAGADAFVAKPFELDALITAVEG